MVESLTRSESKAKWSSLCNQCGQKSTDLKVCTRCNIVYYCGKDCQTKAYKRHKKLCRQIKKDKDNMDKEEVDLRNGEEDPWEFFEENLGHFWGLVFPRDWLRAKWKLAQTIIEAGKAENNKYAFHVALEEHIMEILRLVHGDNIGVRWCAPFLMIALQRYQDCHDFIAWYTLIGGQRDYDWGNAPKIEKGGWKFLKNEDILGKLPLDDMDDEHLLAEILLKTIIFRHRMNSNTQFNEAGEQGDILDLYCNKMDCCVNSYILPALVHPDPIMKVPMPIQGLFLFGSSRNSVENARKMIEYRYFFEITNSIAFFRYRYAEVDLDYDPTPLMHSSVMSKEVEESYRNGEVKKDTEEMMKRLRRYMRNSSGNGSQSDLNAFMMAENLRCWDEYQKSQGK